MKLALKAGALVVIAIAAAMRALEEIDERLLRRELEPDVFHARDISWTRR